MKPKLTMTLLSAAVAGAAILTQFDAATGEDFARDPGVRGGAPGAGAPLEGLSYHELRFFALGKEEFEEAEEVAEGLGPTMNLDGCGGCHAQPAIGGTSPVLNPQVAFAKAAYPSQLPAVDAFIRYNGPVREARFVRNGDGTPDGGVHALFTITGREGAANCDLKQPDFEGELARNNVIFRIPTPVFGAGLIEQIPDAAILANQLANYYEKRDLGIRGKPNYVLAGRTITGSPNRNGNDGTIARFGWKAQNQSLLIFSGEAYNVEMGITNEAFQSEREQAAECQFAPVPNDTQNFDAADALAGTTAIQHFANFQRFLAPPKPSPDTPGGAWSIGRGRALFSDVGCAHCHTPRLKTGNSSVAALRYRDANLYSDLLVHDMGVGLADGVSQGGAGPREFRTAPLWGLGQRLFFLHDGRTADLRVAIREHYSDGSEANAVVRRYFDLREYQKQDLLNFLRSL